MAVTSLKPVSYNVRTAINYVRNPEKTRAQGLEALAALHAVRGSIHYAEDNIKTERSLYVTHINCNEADAIQQFQSTKILWNKTRGRACYHGYQSFMEGEVTAEQAHAIGVELAKRLWGERFEVVVATHLNTNHYHNHFILNSVSWRDGYKFRNAPEDYAEMRRVSDELCREYGLSVVAPDPQSRHKSYGERMAEKQGRPTYVSMIRRDIDRAVAASTTERHLYSCIKHTVTSCTIDGKVTTIAQDTTKTKSSMRTLPLVPVFKDKLIALKRKQEENRRLCGRSYCREYIGYICVDEMGTRMSPNYITTGFSKLLKKNGLRAIRFHDLRHSCASLLLANGVPLKHIQEWLGHSDFTTTANIYAHLDYKSKITSAQAMETGLALPEGGSFESKWKVTENAG